MALGNMGVFFFVPPSSKQSGHFVLFLQLTGSVGYLVLSEISVQHCGH